jgi:PAS domain S-box-containing protein
VRLHLLLALTLLAPLHARELPIRIFTTLDGLVHNRVQRIVADSRGLLWICTGGGLSRFDGAQFQSFGLAEGLPFASVNDLLETQSADFWVATNGGGIVRFALAGTPRFESFPVSPDVTSNRVNSLYRAADGAIWLGTDGGLFRMTVDSQRKPSISRVPLRLPGHPEETVQIWAALTGPDGTLWLATRFGALRLLDGGRVIQYPVRPGRETDVATSLLFLPGDNRLWMGHQDGLVIFQPPPASTYAATARPGEPLVDLSIVNSTVGRTFDLLADRPTLPEQAGAASFFDTARFAASAQVGQIMRFQDGVVRVFMNGTLLEFNSGRFTVISDPRIQYTSQGSGAEDREGNLWVATRLGALRVARHGFATFREPDGLGHQVSSVFADRNGNVVAVSQDWRVSRFNGESFQTVRLRVPPPVVQVGWRGDQDALQDREGDWWFATRAGLMHYHGVARFEDLATATPRLYTSRDGLPQDSVLRLFQDSRGDLWFASLIPAREVLTRWERSTGKFHRYSDADGLPPFNAPTAFYEDPHGNLWIGFRDGGLARHRDGRFTLLTAASGLPAGNISNLMGDRAGRLWFTNRSNLLRIDDINASPLKPVLVAGPRELRGGALTRAAQDRAGNVYAMTGVGMFRINPAGGDRIDGLFTVGEGLADNEVYSTYCDPRGNLWLATGQGLSMYQPAAAPRRQAPPVRIGGVRIAGEEYRVSAAGEQSVEGLELKPGATQFAIDFFGIGFAAGDALTFEYRLLGADDRWSPPGPVRSVQWANIAPGSYEFQVRAISGSGERSPQPARVVFRVLPPVWRRWWFVTMAGFAVAAAFASFERYRARGRRAVAESELRFRTLAETASDAIVTIDDSGTMTYVNPAVETIFGYTPAELLGRELTVLMPETMRDRHRAGLSRYRSTGERRLSWKAIELPGLRKDGREIPLEVAFGEFRREGRHYFTGTIRDISERKHAEEALRKTREERFAELERVRKRIAADLHDEIGSSLTQISILSEVACRRGAEADPGLNHPLSAIATSSRELVDAMSDIVWAINPAKDHLSDLTQRMRRLASDAFSASNIGFHLELPHAEEDLKMGANLRREIFLIFKEGINNMVKHSGCTEATVRLTVNHAALRLELTDNGRGFDPSLPVDGHGLSSLKGRAAALGGTLAIASAPGAGTSITFDLPIPS